MQANEVLTAAGPHQRAPQIASWRHLAGFLLIGAGVVSLGLIAQHALAVGTGASTKQLGRHSQAIHLYLAAMLMDWFLLYYCWIGVHRRGGSLKALSGGRWTSWKSLAIDVGIAVPFWALWEAAAYSIHQLLGPSQARSVDSLLPQSLLEVLIWIATSVTAGICEEMAFRGYLQRQFHALSGTIVMAVLGQGLVFGLFHAYQGWDNGDRNLCAWSSVWNTGRVAQKCPGEHHCPCMGRRLVWLVEVLSLEIDRDLTLVSRQHSSLITGNPEIIRLGKSRPTTGERSVRSAPRRCREVIVQARHGVEYPRVYSLWSAF